jgi:hypothetical protein
MADERAMPSIPRVVTLSAESFRAALADLVPAVECVPVASPYEAAAEMIAAPAMAIVIDLRLMAPRHLRLLQIARQRGAEVLGVGGIPAGLTAEDLGGVRLIARADLKAALQAVLKAREGRYEGAAPTDGKRTALVPARPDGRAASPSNGHVATRPADPPRPHLDEQAPPRAQAPAPRRQAPSAPPAQQPPPAPRHEQNPDPRGILSEEEMAALLEDEP